MFDFEKQIKLAFIAIFNYYLQKYLRLKTLVEICSDIFLIHFHIILIVIYHNTKKLLKSFHSWRKFRCIFIIRCNTSVKKISRRPNEKLSGQCDQSIFLHMFLYPIIQSVFQIKLFIRIVSIYSKWLQSKYSFTVF